MMPSNRRLKGFFLLAVLLILLTLYITASGRQTRSSEFYTSTQDALSAAKAAKQAKLADMEHALGEDSMVSHRLKAAEEAAKRKADEKAEMFHGEETKQKALKVKERLEQDEDVETASSKSSKSSKSGKSSKSSTGGRRDPEEGEKAVAGRIVMKDPKESVLKANDEDDFESKSDKHVEKVDKEAEIENEDESDTPHEETEDERKAHAELNDILKKSPIIIFSKTYCPYSRRAKHILLEKYKITPSPYVVELDIHPLGKQLQSYLGGITGRKTVPNILVRAKSIGGGDDVQELDEKGKLKDTLRRMGGKQVQVEMVLSEAERDAMRKRDAEVAEKNRRRHFWS
ncbi:glutaredoxin [Verruconis gallopava]|uniref:Glutaredoxin n=1 Tax=Verruconis gallopava TaxID=253628 RepID=A0A0D1YKN9_9PEZI|nr:glutaredoxin [Verruconis gallopava]KIW01412.1 glutaredoxin [Verruconis gallopava]